MIDILTDKNIADWKEIRLEGLRDSPQAFGESYETEFNKPDSEQAEQLRKSTIFAYRNAEGQITGVLGFYIPQYMKMQHRGHLFCMYVRPQFRNSGIATQLLETAIEYAKTKVKQLHITVVTENATAISLYEKHGFNVYGTEPRALCIEGIYYDEHLMIKML